MPARRAGASTSKNGVVKHEPRIKNADVDRVVQEFKPSGKNGYVNTKVQIHFKVMANGANAVSVAGTFNDWNPKGTPLSKSGDGWDTTITLPRGRYEYRFIVDGKWLSDPNARESVPNPFGGSNSVLSV
jgi:1,4-alpha-glucan branching enzyme